MHEALRRIGSPTVFIVAGLAMLAAAAPTQPALAAEFNMEVTAAGISLGPQVSGPVITKESLPHRVVLLEFWGVNCPPCIASMPALQQMHEKLSPAGLLIVGAHAQGGTAEELKPKVAELGVTFPIVEHAEVQGGGDFGGIPHCMVFDHTGKCIFRGSPFEAHDAVVKAVAVAPSSVLEGRTLVKLAAFNELLRNEANFGSCLKKAKGMASAKDAETAAEAQYVAEKVEARGRTMLEQAGKMKDSDPVAAVEMAQRCSVTFKGDAIGTDAGKLLREWKKDRVLQNAIKANQSLAKLEGIRAAVIRAAGGGGNEITPEMAGQTPIPIKAQIKEAAQAIGRLCPDSPVAAKAAAIAAEFAVEPAPAR